jgi:TRAP-type transport system periplasmic protein
VKPFQQFVISAAALAVAGLPPALGAAEVKLKAASFLPQRSIVVKPFMRFVDEVNKTCAGKVAITVVGPEAVPSLEQWNALKSGVVDMHYGPPNYFRGVVPAGDVVSVARNELTEQRKNGAWGMINELYNRQLNAWYLTYLLNGERFYVYTNKPAKGGHFDGFRLRSVPVYDGFFRSLGAQPLRMAPPEVYTALERGTVDGYGWPLWGVHDFGWDKYTKYRYGPGFINAAVVIIVNLDKWKSLADDQRACLSEVTERVETQWPAWKKEIDVEQEGLQKKAGIEYVDLGPQFAEKAEDIYWSELAKGDPDFVKKIRPLLTK